MIINISEVLRFPGTLKNAGSVYYRRYRLTIWTTTFLKMTQGGCLVWRMLARIDGFGVNKIIFIYYINLLTLVNVFSDIYNIFHAIISRPAVRYNSADGLQSMLQKLLLLHTRIRQAAQHVTSQRLVLWRRSIEFQTSQDIRFQSPPVRSPVHQGCWFVRKASCTDRGPQGGRHELKMANWS